VPAAVTVPVSEPSNVLKSPRTVACPGNDAEADLRVRRIDVQVQWGRGGGGSGHVIAPVCRLVGQPAPTGGHSRQSHAELSATLNHPFARYDLPIRVGHAVFTNGYDVVHATG
jgi:hypothetical protein